MSNPQPVKRLNDVHMQILDYILANPGCTYQQISAHTGGYSIGWISQIVNSDAFQALLAERQVDAWGEVKMTIKDRVTGLAHESLRRLTEKVAVEQDTDKVANAADLALKALGFTGKGSAPAVGPAAIGQQNNLTIVGAVDRQTLDAARQLMHKPAESAKDLPPALPDLVPAK